MTNAERERQAAEARARFYAWTPADADLDRTFRCHHTKSLHIMEESQCKAAAANPEIFQERCGAHGKRRCPRWRHYRKLHNKSTKQKPGDGLVRRAYK